MGSWTRKPLPGAQLLKLGLTAEEGFVLSRFQTPLSMPEVVSLTGLPVPRVEEILTVLATKGVIESDEPSPAPPAPPVLDELIEEGPADAPPLDELIEEGPAGEGDDAPPGADADAEQAEELAAKEEDKRSAVDDANYRKLYETEFRGLPKDEREGAARTADGPRLMALCYDPESSVIRNVLDNRASNLQHARLAARSHGTSAGLELITQRAPLLADQQVQRSLLRNQQLTEILAKRVLSPKRMIDAYKVSVDVDVPERTRAYARGVLRSKWATVQGEERAGIISATEGRVLVALTGLTLDGRATAILCARSYTSILFIQNLARFGACPPVLLAHLLKQQIVRRQQHLKNMLLKHPNMPSDAKRRA